ncbi:hypothetical protein BHE74_00044099 [Ensete ventricosum]|nr:hypothetical protein BHE74_00044099 [Ensete ventricosum]
MLTCPPRHRALGQLVRRRGRPDAGSRSDTSMRGVSSRTADLTQVRSTPLTCRRTPHRKTTGMMEGYDDMISHKGNKVARSRRPTRAEAPPPDPNSTTPAANLWGRTRGIHPSGRAPTLSRNDNGRTSAQGPEPAMLTQWIRKQGESTGQAPDLTLTYFISGYSTMPSTSVPFEMQSSSSIADMEVPHECKVRDNSSIPY